MARNHSKASRRQGLDLAYRLVVMHLLLALLSVPPLLASAADLGVPLSWREFGTNRSRSERVSIAQNAINQLIPHLDTSTSEFEVLGFWQSANAFSSMALKDWITGTTDNKATVTNNINNIYKLYPTADKFQFNDDAMWWATAAYYGSRSYGDSNLLNHAIVTWNFVSQFQISQANANAGSHPKKNFPLAKTCDGVTMAGGVFWRPTIDDTSVNAITTGLFATLSAYLAEKTGDSKYSNAAIAAVNWMKAHDYDNNAHIVLDTVHANDCSKSPANWLFTYNSGKFIEGLSVLASVTKDAQWTNLLTDTLAAAVKSSAWQGSNGVITEGASPDSDNDGVGFKAIFIRGLYEAFNRSTNNDLRILVHSYVDVQFNALLELAGANDVYSSAWAGPKPSKFTTWGQLAALDSLVSAIGANSP